MNSSRNRIEAIDALRGLAVGGMLAVNLGIFSGAAFVPHTYLDPLGKAGRFVVLALAEGKFFPIFAFLFGWGIARQIKRAPGAPPAPSPLGRILLLSLFGAAHAILFWSGDILLPYAILGLLILGLKKARAPVLLAAAGFSLLLASTLALPFPGTEIYTRYIQWVSPALAHIGPPQADLLHPVTDIWQAAQNRLWETAARLLFFPSWLGTYFASILLGFLAGREGWLEKLSHLSLTRRWKAMLGGAVLAGLSLNLLYALLKTNLLPCPEALKPFWEKLLPALGGPLLAAGYALVIVTLEGSTRMHTWPRPLACLGQISLTAYLSQSAVCSLLFSAYGLGLYGRIPAAGLAGLGLLIYLAQIVFSGIWLRRFRNGPLEGLLKMRVNARFWG